MAIFTEMIETDVGLLEFSFTSVQSKYGLRYYINVTDHIQKYHYFTMNEKAGSWQFEKAINLPSWLQKLKRKISLVIIEKGS